MLQMQHHQDGLSRRLFVIGIPSYTIKPFLAEMVKWENCNGVEWTTKRLKSLKVDLIRRHSHLEPLTWVRKNRRKDVAGVIGSLFRWSDQSERNFAKCIQAFMAYTFYIYPSLTESQKDKFLSGIQPSNPHHLSSKTLLSFRETVEAAVHRRLVGVPHQPLVVYRGSPDKRAPRLFGRKSVPQNEKILDDLQIFNTSEGLSLYCEFSSLYRPLLQGCKERRDRLDSIARNNYYVTRGIPRPDYSPYGGEIHFLQEPGGKLRSVASPLRIHQEALRPLGEEIYRLIQLLPWDCTFDQSRALPHIQSHLLSGGQVHSVDLSSATDHFPLDLQEVALRAIFGDSDPSIDLFVKISRSRWKSPIGELMWTKGQPLGLYPSFGAFTLTHGLLLLHLAGGHYDNQFFVVGDDVVILEDSLRDSYISMLDQMSCPWSEDKSLSSSKLAEFAGKIITPTRVIPQLKWRKMSNDNFLDLCRLLGKKSRCLLSSRQKEVFDKVQHLVEPVGLNFSYPGSNLTKMVEDTLDFYQPEKVILGSLMGLRKSINHLIYHSSEVLCSDELEELSATFDEKVKSALSKTLFSRWSTSCSIGVDGLSSLPEALGIDSRLPLVCPPLSRRSTLDRYLRIIQSQG